MKPQHPFILETQKRTTLILDFAHRFFFPGDIIEFRVLRYHADDHIRYNLSGYFDYDHLAELAKHAARVSGGADGVYWTINPLKNECLGRRPNRVSQAHKDESAKDDDVKERRWVVIDIDSKRDDSKNSATVDERVAVFAGADLVEDFLAAGGWDAKHKVDSGNGVHLYYECPPEMLDCSEMITVNNEVHSFLEKLAGKFPELQIDTTVSNLARIMRIPGTKNCKGKPTRERPHREAKII